MNSPKIMFIRVSTKCNSNCFMCKYAGNNQSYNLTNEQFEMILLKMKKENTYKLVRFTGGEPLLHPNLAYFIKRCKDEGLKTSIITNGFLMPNKYKSLADSGIDQVIFSLDGSSAEIHDKVRNFNGCFNNIMKGIELIKQYKEDTIIRINTVASKYNVDDLINILNLLKEKGVDQWSIIPLKSSKELWNDGNIEQYIKKYDEFEDRVKNIEKPKLLGYSKQWAGRNDEEKYELFYNNKLYHPNNKCNTVDIVRFYIPDTNEIIPCNCASHRLNQIDIKGKNKSSSVDEVTEITRKWLKEYAPKVCTGCEPLNAYLSENPEIVNNDIFLF